MSRFGLLPTMAALAAMAVPYQAGLGEWIQLPDTWVGNAHRAVSGQTDVDGVGDAK